MAGPLWQCLLCDGPSNLEVVDKLKSYFEICKKNALGCKRSVISIVEKVRGTSNNIVVCCVDKRMSKPIENIFKCLFKLSLRTCWEARSYWLRKYLIEWQFSSSFHTVESKERT